MYYIYVLWGGGGGGIEPVLPIEEILKNPFKSPSRYSSSKYFKGTKLRGNAPLGMTTGPRTRSNL